MEDPHCLLNVVDALGDVALVEPVSLSFGLGSSRLGQVLSLLMPFLQC